MSWKLLDRLEAQLLDCLRSVVANIEEGFARATTSEYLQFLGYSQASLKEAKGDIQRMRQDGILVSTPRSSLTTIGINLKSWHEALKEATVSKPTQSHKLPLHSSKGTYGKLGESKTNNSHKSPQNPLSSSKENYEELREYKTNNSYKPPQNPLHSFKFGYGPVDNLDPSQITYEILIELTNKTDYLLRKLVESLETKLNSEQKGYQVEKARIRSNLKTN